MAAPAPSPIAGLEPCSHGGPDPIDDVPTQAPASPAQRFAAPDVQQRLFDAPAQDAAPSPFAIPSGFVEAEDSAPEPQPAPDPRPAPQSERAFVPEPVPAASRPPAFSPPSGSAAERLKSSDLAELSPVELVERLAISLQQRRNAAPTREDADFAPAPQVEAPQPPAPAMARFEPIEPQAPALPAEAAAPAAQRALPAALRPLSFDDEDEDIAEAPSFALPPRHVAATGLAASSASGPSEDAPDETGEDDLDEGYSSLLELSRQSASRGPGAKQTFIRIEEPDHTPGDAFEPVVVFPGQASRLQGAERTPEPLVPDTPAGAPGGEPPAALPEVAPVTAQAVRRFDNPALQSPAGMAGRKDPEEAERALRSALATLQRMSGAA